MSQKRSRVSAKNITGILNFADAANSRMEAEELLNEIDNLAVLLHEVKKQTDRIEAAADAIGDAILSHLRTGRTTSSNGRAVRRSSSPIQPKANVRLRAIPAHATQMSDGRF